MSELSVIGAGCPVKSFMMIQFLYPIKLTLKISLHNKISDMKRNTNLIDVTFLNNGDCCQF